VAGWAGVRPEKNEERYYPIHMPGIDAITIEKQEEFL
jgi:hypothetical protein